MKRKDPSLTFDEDAHKVKNRRLSVEPTVLSKINEKVGCQLPRNIAEDDDRELASRKITHGFHLVTGKMGHGMEDYIVAENRKVNGYELDYMQFLMDIQVVKLRNTCKLQSHLFDNILDEPDFWTKPKEAIERAYKATDDEILERVVGSRGGSTAVTSMLINGKKLIVANVGDSRAVLCRDGVAKQITVDHDPEKERDDVESRGGYVLKRPEVFSYNIIRAEVVTSKMNLGNIPRVDGQLAMTRAFGDGQLKEHITSEPDITVQKIDDETDFIILASDGLWNVMSSQEAYDCIAELDDAQEAAKDLIGHALSRKSSDDISCIVVAFQ